jgi:hypothetical protein
METDAVSETFYGTLEFHAIDKVQKSSNSKFYTQSSERFRF